MRKLQFSIFFQRPLARMGPRLACIVRPRRAIAFSALCALVFSSQPYPAYSQTSNETARRICSRNWNTESLVIPVYLAWIDTTNDRTLNNFKSNIGGGTIIRNPRVISASSTEVICRFDIYSRIIGGRVTSLQVKDLDFRYVEVSGAPTWELTTFPTVHVTRLSPLQVQELIARLYVDDVPYRQQAPSQQPQPAQPRPRNVLEALGQAQAQSNAATEEYLRAQGVDVDAIKQADETETRKYAEPCRRNGGTWGRPSDNRGNVGRLGCYYPTGGRD